MTAAEPREFVSRAGHKLAHALDAFGLDVTGLRCVDLGCNVGGFTDCLLQRGAASVHAIDTGYGVLDYRLRQDERVVVRERTNALHAEPAGSPVDLAVIDLGWTRQVHAIPAALRWLGPGGRIVSLLKPHYEAIGDERRLLVKGRLDPEAARAIVTRVLEELPGLGVIPLAATRSPLEGGKSGRKGKGNTEFLVLARREEAGATPYTPP